MVDILKPKKKGTHTQQFSKVWFNLIFRRFTNVMAVLLASTVSTTVVVTVQMTLHVSNRLVTVIDGVIWVTPVTTAANVHVSDGSKID